MNAVSCPDRAQLREHLEGTLAEPAEAELLVHLDTCAGCQQTLEELAEGEEPLLRIARQLGEQPPAPMPTLQQVLKELIEPEPAMETASEEVCAFLSPAEQPGQLGRLGPYQVLEVLGHGSMGVVFKAFDPVLERLVAIKVLARKGTANAVIRRRFLREARAAAAVRNEYVIDIYAVEEINGLPCLVMEYVAGGSLQDRLDRGGRLEITEIVRIGRQTAAGLAAAHTQGLIHRDIKPANILLEAGGERVKITDFGLARATNDLQLTLRGVVAGTPQYMAPEQARGEHVDHRADLFSLGSVLYALCAGQPPFSAENTLAVLRSVSDDTPQALQTINPAVPDWLAQIVAKLHAKDPAERFQSASEVAELLGCSLASPDSRTFEARPRWGRRAGTARGWRARRWMMAAAAVVLLAVGLSLTEASNITRLGATLVRILTPVGTLVIEVDDPAVKVTVEGDGGIIVAGAGPQEVRLRPGSYRYMATRDGKLLETELVTIKRGDTQTVRIRLENTQPLVAIREIRQFSGHISSVHSLALSADGRRALTGSWDQTVRVWDVESGRELRCFSPRDGVDHAIYCVALSPDGRLALAGSRQGTIWLWDVETGEERGRCKVPVVGTVGATALAFSADGKQALVCGYEGLVRVWQVQPWKELCRLDHGQGVWSVCFSPDGRRALIAGACQQVVRVRLWDLQEGKMIRQFECSAKGIWQAVFSPDGRSVLTACTDGILRLFEAESAKLVRCLDGHIGEALCVAFSPDGRRALSAGSDQTIRLWNLETGKELHRIVNRTVVTKSVAYSPRGEQAISGSFDGAVCLWQLPPDEKK